MRNAAGLRSHAEQGALSAFFPLHNMRGLEIDAFAVSLARVTLWMAHKLAVDELDLPEATLPLEDLSGHPGWRCPSRALAKGLGNHRQPALPR